MNEFLHLANPLDKVGPLLCGAATCRLPVYQNAHASGTNHVWLASSDIETLEAVRSIKGIVMDWTGGEV